MNHRGLFDSPCTTARRRSAGATARRAVAVSARRRTLALLLTLTLLTLPGLPAIATEQARFRVELDSPPFQIRTYPARIEARVQVLGSRARSVQAGFRILAAYLFGRNTAHGKLAMTAPVLQTPVDAGPTAAAEADGGWQVAFVMPAAYARAQLPHPDDSRIRFAEVPAHRVAAVQFPGFWSDANFATHADALRGFLARQHLMALSGPRYAFYNPPWTPWFWRRNEVQVDVSAGGGAASTLAPRNTP